MPYIGIIFKEKSHFPHFFFTKCVPASLDWQRTLYVCVGVCVCVWYIVFCGCQCVRASVTRQRTQDMELTEFTCSSSDAWPPECMQCSKKENTHTHTLIFPYYIHTSRPLIHMFKSIVFALFRPHCHPLHGNTEYIEEVWLNMRLRCNISW